MVAFVDTTVRLLNETIGWSGHLSLQLQVLSLASYRYIQTNDHWVMKVAIRQFLVCNRFVGFIR